jgi:hypothetical protein
LVKEDLRISRKKVDPNYTSVTTSDTEKQMSEESPESYKKKYLKNASPSE